MFIKKIFKSLKYYFFDIKWSITFKIIYFFEKILQYFWTVLKYKFSINIKYPFLFKKDYIVENKVWKFFIKSNSDYDYPIQPYVEDNHYKYWKMNDWDIFVDIWAHVWIYAIKLLNYNKWKNIKVYCFEPNPETYTYLCKNIELNNFQETIFPINKWVYSSNWTIWFTNYKSKDAAVSKIIVDENIKDKIVVDIVKFDDYINKNNIESSKIWLIKIDVEWFEYDVINWMDNYLSNSNNVKIICEILDVDKINKVKNYIDSKWLLIKHIDDFNFFIYSK